MSPSLWISQDYFPATAPPRPSFPDEPKFLDSLPDVSQFLCLMFPDFFAWCFPISLPNVSWFLCLCIPIAWCSLVSFSDVSQFLDLMFPDFLAWYLPMSLPNISLPFPYEPFDFLRPGSFYNSNSLIWVRDFHLEIIFTQLSLLLFIHLEFWANNSPS